MIEVADHCLFNYLTSLVLIKTLLAISGCFKLLIFISLIFCYHLILLDAFFVYNRIYNNVNSSGVTTIYNAEFLFTTNNYFFLSHI